MTTNFNSVRLALAALAFLITLERSAVGQQPTLVDPTFNGSGPGAADDVLAIARDAAGNFLVGGQFQNFGGVSRGHLARLTPAGSVDTLFFNGTGADDNVYAVAAQPDGRILIGGSFTEVHGESRTFLARLEPNGQLDTTFAAVSIDDELRAIAVQPDGRILIAGRFTQVEGQGRNRIARLMPEGSLDPSFLPGTGANDNIRTLLRLADGRILIGGQFTTYNGLNRTRLARLHATGAIDPTFDPGSGADGQVRAIATNAAGLVYVGGDFTQVNGTNRQGIARLFPGGALDLSFAPTNSPAAAVRALAVADDGKVWAGGGFTVMGGEPRRNLARLHTNGVADVFFQPFPGPDNEVFSIVLDGTNGVVFGGDFRSVDSFARSRIARLNLDASGSGFRLALIDTVINEDSGRLSVVVERVGALGAPASVSLVTRNGTALAGQDFGPFNDQATFGPFDSFATVFVPLLDDGLAEGEEWFDVQLLVEPNEPSNPNNPFVRITILDNEFQATVDDGFQTDSVNGAIHATAPLPDGRTIIGGEFIYRGSCLENSLSRLTPLGLVDCDFTAFSTGINGPVLAVAVQTNGYILAGGAMTHFSSQLDRHLVRFEPNGFADTIFQVGMNFNDAVLAVIVQDDGRILVGGMFTAFGTNAQPYLLRLLPNGTFDDTFRPEVNGFIRALRLTTDQRLFAAGDFTLANGTPRGRVARFHHNGSLDAAFSPVPGADGSVMTLAEQPDGRIVIGGEFSLVDGQTRQCVARLTSTGGIDPSFNAGSFGGGGRVNTVAVQSDGKVVIGGLFGQVGGEPRTFLTRLLPSGVLDTGFPAAGTDGQVRSIQVLANGQLLVAGEFSRIAGVSRRYIARLNPEPTLGRIELAAETLEALESAGPFSIVIRRVGPSDRTMTVDYTTLSVTADAGTDFHPISGTLTFAPLETVKTVTIPLVNDGLPETPEWFRLRLVNPTGGAFLGSPAESILTVVDNDGGMEFSAPVVRVQEGAPSATLVVARNSDGPGSVTVDYSTVPGTATPRSDFVPTNGTLVFLPGEREKTVVVPLFDNPEFEGRESFRVVLSQPSLGIVLGSNATATVLIEDQDGAFSFGIVNDAPEGLWPALFYVRRLGLITQSATVRLMTDGGSATRGFDFLPIDRVLTFAPGEFLQEFYLTNLNDGLVEGTEHVRLTLVEPTGLSIIESPGFAESAILDNDRGVEFIAPEFYVNEFSSHATARVRRGDDGDGALTVRYEVQAESAEAGRDFLVRSGTLTLPPGETNAQITIPILQDQIVEARESFRVRLFDPGPGATLETQSVVRVIVLDDEKAGSIDVSFQVDAGELSEFGGLGEISLAPHTRDQLLVGARFRVRRLESDGRTDTNFFPNPNEHFFTPVMHQRRDGKIWVGGSSSNGFGAGSPCLRLLNTNGTPDLTFQFPINFGRTAAIALQDDERIVLGGDFAIPFSGTVASVLRVLPSGALDPEFALARFDRFNPFVIAPSTVETVTIQPDGRILAAGDFAKVNDQSREHIVRLLSDGALDPDFQGPRVLPSPDAAVFFPDRPSAIRALAVQPDGRILIGGSFTNLAGAMAHHLARLRPDGSLDPTFNSPLEAWESVAAFALQADGRLVIAVNYWLGDSYAFVSRLRPDGSFDPDFEFSTLPGNITDLILLPGGDIAFAGSFTQVEGIPLPAVVRLRGDGLFLRCEPAASGSIRLDLFNTYPGGVTVLEESVNLADWRSVRTNLASGPLQQWLKPVTGSPRFYRALHWKPEP